MITHSSHTAQPELSGDVGQDLRGGRRGGGLGVGVRRLLDLLFTLQKVRRANSGGSPRIFPTSAIATAIAAADCITRALYWIFQLLTSSSLCSISRLPQ